MKIVTCILCYNKWTKFKQMINNIQYRNIYTVKPLYKKLFFFSTFFLIERFSYKEVFTFPLILRINL